MRTISNQMGEGNTIRIVGLCTSLANAKDLGEWIGATSHGLYNFPPGMLRMQAFPDASFPMGTSIGNTCKGACHLISSTAHWHVCCVVGLVYVWTSLSSAAAEDNDKVIE